MKSRARVKDGPKSHRRTGPAAPTAAAPSATAATARRHGGGHEKRRVPKTIHGVDVGTFLDAFYDRGAVGELRVEEEVARDFVWKVTATAAVAASAIVVFVVVVAAAVAYFGRKSKGGCGRLGVGGVAGR